MQKECTLDTGSLLAILLQFLAKKNPQKFHKPLHSSQISMFDNHIILFVWLQNKQTLHTLSLLDLHFMLCSRDLDVLRAQRIIGLFSLITHKPTWSESTCVLLIASDSDSIC